MIDLLIAYGFFLLKVITVLAVILIPIMVIASSTKHKKETDKGKICIAQTIPTKRAPAAIKRDKSKLFVTFRPSESIKDEISLTSGHDYKSSTVTASSGTRRYSFFYKKNFC